MEKIFRYGKMLVPFTILLSAYACRQADSQAQLVLDIPAIAHRSPEQVQAVLGQPDSSYFQKRGKKR